MTMSGGRASGIWTGGTVILLALSVFVARWVVGPREEEAPAFSLRDSSGVTIAESLRPAWAEGGAWRVDQEPILRLGVVEGDPHQQFDGVTGALRLEGGGVVVADGGFQEVRYFSSAGEWTSTFGRPGEGPEEFTGLAALGLGPGGRIWAYDFSLRRVSWLDESGEAVGLTTLGSIPPTLNAVGALSDGTFVLKQLWGAEAVSTAERTGLRRDPVAYVRFDADGALVDTLGLFTGREVYLWDENGRGVMGTPPFARNSVGSVWGEGVVVGSQETFQVEVFTSQGELARIVRIPTPELALGPRDLEGFIQSRLEATPPDRRPGMREQIEAMAMPPTRPAYGGLLGDSMGNLWLSEWAMYPHFPERWTVLDPEGRWLGAVAMPPNFHPMDIGEDWILGVERDELDVEYVVIYPLRPTT